MCQMKGLLVSKRGIRLHIHFRLPRNHITWTSDLLAGLLIPADSRIHSDQAWVDENIPYELRIVQFVFDDENVLTKEVLLGVCSFG